ncbi:hypothetical protein EOS93_05900 [Rhizobium sp. RMa-01]|nr:hypothetical protein EOS93_05900 [Rhizobium sp. RMa-01]
MIFKAPRVQEDALLLSLTQFRTENRFALFLELLGLRPPGGGLPTSCRTCCRGRARKTASGHP